MKSMLDGFMALPVFIREIGVVGALLFGKKGFLALAGVSILVDKILDVIDATKQSFGIFDDKSLKSTKAQIKSITKEMNRIETQIESNNDGSGLGIQLTKFQVMKLKEKHTEKVS